MKWVNAGEREIVQVIRRLKAQRALSRLRQQAALRGLDRFSPQEIEKQIREVRSKRKTR
jgi:predicted component of type VI protein secretion system